MTKHPPFGENDRLLVGIDPGWKNLGWALLLAREGEVLMLGRGVLNPSKSSIGAFPGVLHDALITACLESQIQPTNLTGAELGIERYVSYAGVQTSESENILMVIGSLLRWWETASAHAPVLYRAIEWKSTLVKALFKKRGFRNPSNDLDKDFSMAAAKACLAPLSKSEEPATLESSTSKPKKDFTHHEADAICLAAITVFAPAAKRP
jgi:hypothetical protein